MFRDEIGGYIRVLGPGICRYGLLVIHSLIHSSPSFTLHLILPLFILLGFHLIKFSH